MKTSRFSVLFIALAVSSFGAAEQSSIPSARLPRARVHQAPSVFVTPPAESAEATEEAGATTLEEVVVTESRPPGAAEVNRPALPPKEFSLHRGGPFAKGKVGPMTMGMWGRPEPKPEDTPAKTQPQQQTYDIELVHGEW